MCLLATQDSDNEMYCALEVEVLIYGLSAPWREAVKNLRSSSSVDTFSVFFFTLLFEKVIFSNIQLSFYFFVHMSHV